MSMQLHHTLMSQYKHGTASGIGSVSYESVANCVTPEVVIYGKCVQDGTPTPDAPVDIVCNNNTYECRSKNLFNGELRVGYFKSVSGATTTDQVKYRSLYTDLPAGDYVLSFSDPMRIVRTLLGGELKTIAVIGTSLTFTTNGGKVGFSWARNDGAEWDDSTLIQIERGTVATPYEPYFNGGTVIASELYAVGDVRDEYYPLTGKVIRRCRKVDVSSLTTWWQYPSSSQTELIDQKGLSFCTLANGAIKGYNTSICTHFENVKASFGAAYKCALGIYSDDASTAGKYFRAPNESVTTVAEFKAWLDEQKALGKPVILVYQLASPVIEYVDPVQITSVRGANIIEETDLMSELFDIPFVTGTQIDVKYLTHS